MRVLESFIAETTMEYLKNVGDREKRKYKYAFTELESWNRKSGRFPQIYGPETEKVTYVLLHWVNITKNDGNIGHYFHLIKYSFLFIYAQLIICNRFYNSYMLYMNGLSNFNIIIFNKHSIFKHSNENKNK